MSSLAARIPSPFPLPDSIGWLRPEEGRQEAVKVRIVQHDRRDGTVRVSAADPRYQAEQASAFRRVELAEIYETEAEAIGEPCKRCRGTGQRRRSQRGAMKLDTCPMCHGTRRLFP